MLEKLQVWRGVESLIKEDMDVDFIVHRIKERSRLLSESSVWELNIIYIQYMAWHYQSTCG